MATTVGVETKQYATVTVDTDDIIVASNVAKEMVASNDKRVDWNERHINHAEVLAINVPATSNSEKENTKKEASAKNELKKKIQELMASENAAENYEAFAEALFESIGSDDEPWRKIGYYMMLAIIQDDVDGLLTAISGWSCESLLAKAELIPDEHHIFH